MRFPRPPFPEGGEGDEFWSFCLAPRGAEVLLELPTVPEFRKISRVDMGSADKMAAAVLGVHRQAERLGIPY